MTKKIIHYNIDEIDKLGASINMIMGERSNGKSFQVKHKKGMNKYWDGCVDYHATYKDKTKVIEEIIKAKTRRFILMRRNKEEIKTSIIQQYFADIDVVSITDGEYNCINVYRQCIYLANYNTETFKTTNGEKIGYLVALSVEQNYAGASYLDVTDIIFEEFISRTNYLVNEPAKLMNFYCTVDRKRGTTRLWLAGNSISRVCPYFYEWGIDELVKNQKQGTIRTKWLDTGTIDEDGKKIEVLFAFEYCADTGASSFVIGRHKKMLNSGAWQSDPQPHLSKSRKEYKKMFKIMFYYKTFKFIGEYLFDYENKSTCWHIYPYTKNKIPKKTLIFSDIIKESVYWQRDIYLPTIKNRKIIDLLKTFKENKIFYATDLCGTDFKQVIDFIIKK